VRPAARVLLGVAGLGLLTSGSLWLLSRGGRGADIATVLSFSVSVLALAVAILGIRWQQAPTDENGRLADAARALSRDVRESEADQQQKFLADTGQPRPANVGFRQPALVRWRSDGGKRQGSMEDIKIFYGGLRHGRLVILGPGGAGKTVLANQLLLDLIGSGTPGGSLPAGPSQVPVRISLASFNSGDDLDNVPAAQTRIRLDEWIASYLTDVHGLTPRVARALLQQGWILPILDGLDEMDSGGGTPRRAAAVIRCLNHPVGGILAPVVITCRTDRYEQLATSYDGPGRQPVLEDATAVEIEPLSSSQVRAYLTYRFPNPANPRGVQERWRPVLASVTSQPRGPLATALSSPLRLFLAVTAYHDPATNPADLIQFPADDLDRYLLDQLIPAVTAQHPKPDGRTYNPDDVTCWLATFADYLETQRTMYEDPAASDIDLHNLWTVAGDRIPLLAAALRGALVAVPLIILAVLYRSLVPNFPYWDLQYFYPIPWPLYFAGVALLIAGAAWSTAQADVELRRLDLSRLRASRARLRIATGLAVGLGLGLGLGIALTGGILTGLGLGLAVGLGIGIPACQRYWREGRRRVGLIVGLAVVAGPDLFIGYSLWGVGATWLAPAFGIIFGLTAGIAGGLAGGLVWGLTQRPAAIRKPSQLVAQGIAYELTLTIAVTLIFGIVFSVQWLAGLISSLWPSFSAVTPWVVLGNVFKLYGGTLVLFYIPKALLLGLTFGIAVGATSPWLLYLITSRILAHRRLLPANPAGFLDWAYSAGLVRLSGIHVQFRHDELQKHLSATQPHPAEPTVQQADGPFPLKAASAGARQRRLLAVSETLLGVLILATAAAPGVIAPAVGSQTAAQRLIPPSIPQPAVTASASPATVVFAFIDAINHQDWPMVWQLGAKNLGIPYAQITHSFPKTVNGDVIMTSAFGSMVSVLLVAAEGRNQTQVYRDVYVVEKGVITSRTQSLVATGPSGGLITSLAGNWYGHDRGLTISTHGLGISQFRLFRYCTENRSLMPCDVLASNEMFYGGVIIFQLTHENGNQATGFVLSSTITAPSSPVSITLGSDDAITLTAAGQAGTDSYCGSYAPAGYCGA
jgi:NACHT domain-containing protein